LVCWKLVRDGVAEELRGRPGVRVVRVSGELLEGLLRAKIVEEAMELAESGSLEEAADLVEALEAWLRLRGLGGGELERARVEKRARRGGFEAGWLVFWLDRDSC